jgi:hypothetical protein
MACLEIGLDRAVVLDDGLGGNRAPRSRVEPSMTDRFTRDVLDSTEATHVILVAVVNDIPLPFVLDETGTIRPSGGSIFESFRADGTNRSARWPTRPSPRSGIGRWLTRGRPRRSS